MTRKQQKRAMQKAAIAEVAKAVRCGLLQKLDGSVKCVDCGNPAVAYDHRDYRLPLQVQPVCLPCNRKRGSAHPFRSSGDVGYEKRKAVVKVRFNDKEMELVKMAAERLGMSVASFARDVIDIHHETIAGSRRT